MNNEKIFSKLKQYFTNVKEVNTAYVFGSVAKNKDREKSDIDIAVLFIEKMSAIDRFEKT